MEMVPGLVRFDGQVIEIDLTSLADLSTGRLVFQLLGSDDDDGSLVAVGPITNTCPKLLSHSKMLWSSRSSKQTGQRQTSQAYNRPSVTIGINNFISWQTPIAAPDNGCAH